MARYLGCGVCMKVCPIQKYGMKNVMEHYAATGQVLGKGTHDLEGYEMEGLGYFGPGELPQFDGGFFDMPHGDATEAAGGEITGDLLDDFKSEIQRTLGLSTDNLEMMYEEEDYI